MRTVQHVKHYRSSSVTQYNEFCNLFLQKPPRSWSINSRESTPYVDRQDYAGPLEHWKKLASYSRDLINSLYPSEDPRRSIDSVEYWRTEAEHLNQLYWILLEKKQKERAIEKQKSDMPVTSGVTKPKTGADGHISSRLRNNRRRPPPESTAKRKGTQKRRSNRVSRSAA